jgi:hypothetical protein
MRASHFSLTQPRALFHLKPRDHKNNNNKIAAARKNLEPQQPASSQSPDPHPACWVGALPGLPMDTRVKLVGRWCVASFTQLAALAAALASERSRTPQSACPERRKGARTTAAPACPCPPLHCGLEALSRLRHRRSLHSQPPPPIIQQERSKERNSRRRKHSC